MEDRQQEIHEKGFNLYRSNDTSNPNVDFGSIKVDVKKLDDATINLGKYDKLETRNMLGNKTYVLQALQQRNAEALREISDYFFVTNGIYQRVCCYFATMYRYDWYISAELYTDSDKIK